MAADRLPEGYGSLLERLKERVWEARSRATLAVNRALVLLYWQIGHEILTRQRAEGWGARVIDRLSADLRRAFPDLRGLSPRNLKYMRAFAEAYPEEAFVQQVVAQLPWGHNVRILDYIKEPSEREWYIRATIAHGWSRTILVHQIESGLYRRQGQALTNFERTLPPPRSELARHALKDPYIFDFLGLGAEAHERDLERGLLAHLRDFLLELGVGFALVGSQVHLEVGGEDFYLDLLFYHLRLRCYVVIDLKIGEFRPEDAGKMNFYLSAADDLLRHPDDQPSLGLILCKDRNRVIAEYALRDMAKPMGIAEYRLMEALPERLQGELPTIEQLEAELDTAHDTAESP
jgi:predicted nuclease of restriction endonuclease-like (RecB) superfamily